MGKDRVIVVGAGPAGLMAAGSAAGMGVPTLLLEKMDRAGRKLLLTGKGRCNLTNEDPLPEFIDHFGTNGRFLRQAFAKFFSPELLDFFESLAIQTIRERGGRIFLASGRADDALNALLAWADRQGAILQTYSPVERLVLEGSKVTGVQLKTLPHIASPGADIRSPSRFIPAAPSSWQQEGHLTLIPAQMGMLTAWLGKPDTVSYLSAQPWFPW
jgi:predicted Rossmann fold flavoprotein